MIEATTRPKNPDAERYIVTCIKLMERERTLARVGDVMESYTGVHDSDDETQIGRQVSYSVDLDPDGVERFERASNLIDLVRIPDFGLGDLRSNEVAPATMEDLRELVPALRETAPLPQEKTYRTGRVIDQSKEGACTFFAATNWLNAYPIPGDYDSAYAFAGYARTKEVDEWPGTNYDGSSVEAALKVCRERGKIKTWGRSQDEAVVERFFKTLSGVIWSMPWCEGMYRPDSRGFIRPTGRLVGRHAIYQYAWTRYKSWGLFNSWGLGFGSRGKGWLAAADRPALRQRGRVEAHLPVQLAA